MSGGADSRRDPNKGKGNGNTQPGHKGNKAHGKQHRRHKKEDPCLALPVAPGIPTVDFINRNHRHHPWWGRVSVADVTLDVDGLLLSMPPRRYCVQVKRKRIGAGSDEPDIEQFYIWNRENDSSGTTTKLFMCHKGWQYSARARAETGLLIKADRSAWSNWSVYQNVTETMFPARNVTVTAPTPRRIMVKWDPPRNAGNFDHVGLDLYRVELYQGATLKETTKTRAEHCRFSVDEADKTKTFNAKVYAIDENAEESAAASSGTVNETGNFTATVAGDGTIPANPVTAHVEGTIGALRVWWDETATVQADPVTYDVYLGTTAGFTISQATQVGSTMGYQMLVVRNPDNSALAIGTDYYVKVRARDLYDGPQTGSTAATENPQRVTAQASDKNPPTSSPAANVLAAAQGLKVSWAATTNNDPVQYEVHVSTNGSFLPTPGASATLFGVFSTTNAFVNKLPPMTPGTDLAVGTTYYVRIIATDFDGAATAGAVSTGVQVQPTPTDGQVPLAVTAVTLVEGGIGWLRPQWTAVPIGARGTGANPDPVTYDVYIKDGSAPTGIASELVATGIAADYCYLHTANSSDTPIVYGHTYFVGVKVRDADGVTAAAITSGNCASGKVVQVDNADIKVDAVQANSIKALSIDGSKLSGQVVLGTSRVVGGASDTPGTNRVVMDGTGINFYKGVSGADVPVIQMKVADGSAKFTGDVAATSLSAPGATLDGPVDITKNGSVRLAAVQGPPNVPPTLSQDLTVGTFPISDYANYDDVQLRTPPWFDGTNYWYITYDNRVGNMMVKVNAAGVVQSRTNFETSINWFFWGMVKLGSYWVGLAYNIGQDFVYWRVYADNAGVPGTLQSSTSYMAAWRGKYEAAITTDGTNICLVQSNDTGAGGTAQLWAATYSTSGGAAPVIIGTRVLSNTTSVQKWSKHVLSLYVGNADFGAQRWVVTTNNNAAAYVFTFVASTSFTEQTAQQVTLPTTPSGTAISPGDTGAVTYIGTGFAQFKDGSDGGMWLFGALPAATYRVAYSWYDSQVTGLTHETLLSPMASIDLQGRWRLNVTWPTIPPGGGTDDPNSVRVYMNDAAPADPAAFGNYFRQGAQFTGISTQFTTYSEATTGARDNAFAGTGASQVVALGGAGVAPLQGSGDGFMPIGVILPFGGTTIPTGWLLCNGQAVSRTGATANLFGVISTTYGVGNGTTTFNVPDLQSRFPVGAGTYRALGLSDNLAENVRTTAHTHGNGSLNINAPSGSGWANTSVSLGGAQQGGTHAHTAATFAGSTASDLGVTVFPHQAVNYIIKT